MFFGSFNDSTKGIFDAAARAIKETINQMFDSSTLTAVAARIERIQRDTECNKAELLRQRQNQWAQSGSSTDSGEFMQTVLRAMAMYQIQVTKDSTTRQISVPSRGTMAEDVKEDSGQTRRSALCNGVRQLKILIAGKEGHGSFRSGRFWMPDVVAISLLQNWMSGQTSLTLWVFSPAITVGISSAQAAAMNAVFAV